MIEYVIISVVFICALAASFWLGMEFEGQSIKEFFDRMATDKKFRDEQFDRLEKQEAAKKKPWK